MESKVREQQNMVVIEVNTYKWPGKYAYTEKGSLQEKADKYPCTGDNKKNRAANWKRATNWTWACLNITNSTIPSCTHIVHLFLKFV